jgi:cytochrome P450
VTTTSTPTIDLTDVDTFAANRHHEMFDWLRANDPVHWQPPGETGGFWSLTRYDDVAAAYTDHTTFSSAGGVMLGGSFRNEVDTAANRMLVASDPPRQRMLRQVMRGVFSPANIDRVAARVEALVDRAITTALADGGCDFATAIAPELPVGALMAIIGISYEDAHELVRLTHEMVGYRDPAVAGAGGDDRLRLAGVQADIFEFFADLVRARRADPRDDLVGILLRAKLNGRPLPEEDILYNCLNVAVGGNETTGYTACSGLIALMDHPDQHERLCADPGLLDGALAEMLRMASTNAYTHRVATRDVEIGGRAITRGESVVLWNVSANRDETHFADPHRFDLARTPNRHLTFGTGIHRCVGAQLGHTELATLFRRVIAAPARFTPAGEPTRLRSNFMLGVTGLPVHLARRSS